MKTLKLPKPKHRCGYYYSQLVEFMNLTELKEFTNWINGQTCTTVNGRIVYYKWDVRRFLELRRFGKETYFD
jgi:hypothetical protein